MTYALRARAKAKSQREPWSFLDSIALLAFVIWSAAGLYFTIKHVTPATIARWQLPDALRQFVEWCLQNGDSILILLAFINTHLHAARQWNAGAARRWAAIILVCAYGIETFGTITSFPFGEYHYTNRFGPMLYLVPLTIPLAWHVVVTNSLFVIRALVPHVSRLTEALLTGMLCTIYDFILEPFASSLKHYWVWTDPTVPPINYIAWFILSALLTRFLVPTISVRYRLDPRPVLILGLTIAIFIAGELK
jgi:uncharacterized membrane protein